MITLLVGDVQDPILAHKDVLSSASPFFEASCRVLDTNIIKLPDEPVVMQAIVYWMYYNQLCLPVCGFLPRIIRFL